MSINFVSSVLFVKDVDVSRKFYEGKLRQEVELDHGECVVFKAGFSIWLKDYAHNLIFKGRHDVLEGHGVELYFETNNIKATRDRLIEAGAGLVHDIEEQPWGQRVFRAYDPDGNIIELAEPMEIVIKRYLAQGSSIEDTVRRTSMPLDIVRQVAGRSG